MKPIVRTVVLLGLLAVTAACLVKDTCHTLYLDPDGRVEWTVLETDVHSDGSDAAAASAEEDGFLAEVRSGTSRVCRALKGLGALEADCRVLRDRRPGAVWTEARFDSLDSLSQSILNQSRVPGQATLRAENGETCFELVCYPYAAGEGSGDDANGLEALVEGYNHFRIVLTRGRFTGATGFRLEDNGRVAGRLLALIRLRLGRQLRTRLESRDILQASLMRAFQRLDQLQGDDSRSLMAWLARIAENEIRDQADYHTRQRRDACRDVPLEDPSLAGLAERIRSQASRLILDEQSERLEQALEALDDHYREIILLRKYEELPFEEIGRRLGRSPDACRMLLARALTALTLRMGERP